MTYQNITLEKIHRQELTNNLNQILIIISVWLKLMVILLSRHYHYVPYANIFLSFNV